MDGELVYMRMGTLHGVGTQEHCRWDEDCDTEDDGSLRSGGEIDHGLLEMCFSR